jgi:hypothetical protein
MCQKFHTCMCLPTLGSDFDTELLSRNSGFAMALLASQLTLHSGLRVQTQDSVRLRNCCDNEPIAGHFPVVLVAYSCSSPIHSPCASAKPKIGDIQKAKTGKVIGPFWSLASRA